VAPVVVDVVAVLVDVTATEVVVTGVGVVVVAATAPVVVGPNTVVELSPLEPAQAAHSTANANAAGQVLLITGAL
jgi:hypothetical protein